MKKASRAIGLLAAFVFAACTSTQKFDDQIQGKNCEQALEVMPEKQNDYRLVSKAQETSGTVLSYSAIGAAYTVQVLWDVTATVGAVTILCAPGFVLVAAAGAGAQSSGSGLCLPGDISKIQAPYLGEKMSKNTENWRCPPVDELSRSIRKVAQCFVDRGGDENRGKALKALKTVSKSGSFYRCLSNSERTAFLKDLDTLQPLSESKL